MRDRGRGRAGLGHSAAIGAWLVAGTVGCHPAGARTGDAVVDVGGSGADGAAKPKGTCSAEGYCWETPWVTPAFLTSVWGSGPNDLYAGNGFGSVAHWDGKAWTLESTGTEKWVTGIWGSGPDDVYAVGEDGLSVHRSGGVWKPIDVGSSVFLEGVWGSGPDDVIVVGADGTVVRYDGKAWSSEKSGTSADLYEVWGTGPNDVYALGQTRGPDSEGVILHHDGASWSEQRLGSDLVGVWGTGPEEVWVAGRDDKGKLAVWKRAGEEWKPVRTPRAGTPLGLTGVGGKPVLLGIGKDDGGNDMSLWNGNVFVLEESDGLFRRRDLLTVSLPIGQPSWGFWGDAKGNAAIVGWWGIAGSLDSKGFHPQTGEGSVLGRNIDGVAGTSPKDVFVAGPGGLLVHYDGSTWTPDPAGKGHDFTGVQTLNGKLVATGRRGLLMVREGGAWKTWDTGVPSDLSAAWAAGDELFVVGAEGAILRCRAGKCQSVPSGTKKNLGAIWGTGPNDVYAVGDQAVLHWDGAEFRMFAVPDKTYFSTVGPDGNGGVLLTSGWSTFRLEGGAWKRVDKEKGAWATADAGDGTIYGVWGGGGAPLGARRWDGSKWVEIPLPLGPFERTAARFTGVWASGGEVFIVGQGGAILHKRR